MQTSYDTNPYFTRSYPHTFIDRLATVGRLLGMTSAPPDQCRVLELGCADGGNLFSMADQFPNSRFVGVDFSSRQISDGQKLVADIGFSNISLHYANILDIHPDFGEFDYIIAHGVFSWIPQHVREHLLRICRRNLAPHGIAYVSYNAYPGWKVLEMLRDAILYRLQGVAEEERSTKAFEMLDLLADTMIDNPVLGQPMSLAAQMLRHNLNASMNDRESYLMHDLLEDTMQPFYLWQVVEQAKQQGLQFLCEADFSQVMALDVEPDLLQLLQGMSRDALEMSQYLDFLRCQSFRRTLLCHREVTVDRMLRLKRLDGLFVTSRARPKDGKLDLRPDIPITFNGADHATVTISHGLSKAALLHLMRNWPRAVPFAELEDAAREHIGPASSDEEREQDQRQLGMSLFHAYCNSTELVNLHSYAPACATTPGEYPVARRLARWQAKRSTEVASFYHESIGLNPLLQGLVQQLDGSKSQDDLLHELVAMAEAGELIRDAEEQPQDGVDITKQLSMALNQALDFLVRAPILTAPELD